MMQATQHHPPAPALDLSIVVPVFDEEDNVVPQAEAILQEADKLGLAYELIFVNDGSRDATAERLDSLAARSAVVRVIHFAANFGQTAALAAGLLAAGGRVIVTMDGDRQNDPSDIGMLLKKLDEGYACVSGWRKNRHDAALRSWVSRRANRLISKVTSVELHDYGCTLKAYRRDALDPTTLFGEMHRFLPVYVKAAGGKVAELVVKHHPRVAGRSKYGLDRTARVLADLALVRLLFKYRTRPVHLFAKAAQYFALAALGFLAASLLMLAAGETAFRPHWGAPFAASVVLFSTSVIIVGIGLVCELVMRSHFFVFDRRPWRIAKTVNFHPPPQRLTRDLAGEQHIARS